MGEEEKKEEVPKEETKEEEKKEEVPPEIVLKVFMHCEACAKKVEKSLRGYEGVEEVKADCKAHKVVVKGKTADPVKICDRVQRKTGRKTELVSPLPNPPEEEKKEEPPKEEEKKEEPTPITVVLKVRMHCDACAQVLNKRIKKMEGVESVETDLPNEQVIVRGFIDPAKLVANVYRRTRKQASIVKEEEKKPEEVEEKKPEEAKQDQEEKAEEKKEASKEEEGDKKAAGHVKKLEYWPPRYHTEYAYAPQIFSDENPNACSVM